MTRTKTLDTTRITRWAAASVMVVGGLMASFSAMNAWADSHGKVAGETKSAAHDMHKHGGMHAGMHGDKHGGMHGGMMLGGRGLEHMLKQVNATDVQRTQIKQIAESARTDIQKLHEGGSAYREQGLALLAQPTVDADAAEKLRQQMLAQHDQVSKRMLTAMLDIGKVLTPEQRATLANRMKEQHAKRESRMQGKAHAH